MKKNLRVSRVIIFCVLLLITQTTKAQTFSYFGSTGNGPTGIAADASGNLWITNGTDYTVSKLNSTGTSIGTFSVGSLPIGIAIDISGNAWVTNYFDNTISRLGPSGAVVGTFPVGDGPFGIANDNSQNAWVVNNQDNNVSKLGPSGTVLGTFPVGNAPNRIAIDGSGNIWVLDNQDNTVSKLGPSGTTLGTFPVGNLAIGIAIDGSGNVYVVNNGDNTVSKLNTAGATLGTFAVGNSPNGIAIDKTGNIWVANNSDNTVSKLSPAGANLGTFAVGNSPNGVATDKSGNVFVLNSGDNSVSKLGAVVLPIDILSFTGIKETKDNLLNWTVSDAVDFRSFELQREDNGVFSTIATVQYVDGHPDYSFKDVDVTSDETYRLALVDLDGKTTYSKIVFIPRDAGSGFIVKAVYPVPATTVLNISLYAPVSTTLQYSIVSMDGKVLIMKESAVDGAVTQTFDISGFAKGTYILNIKTSLGVTKSQKFIKM